MITARMTHLQLSSIWWKNLKRKITSTELMKQPMTLSVSPKAGPIRKVQCTRAKPRCFYLNKSRVIWWIVENQSVLQWQIIIVHQKLPLALRKRKSLAILRPTGYTKHSSKTCFPDRCPINQENQKSSKVTVILMELMYVTFKLRSHFSRNWSYWLMSVKMKNLKPTIDSIRNISVNSKAFSLSATY